MDDTSDDNQAEVVTFLRSGAAFPGNAPVEVAQTHGALIFLCGDTALKLKRAVRYDYMDLSTLALREKMLRRELELNVPAAPTIYRDVLAVTRTADGTLALGGSGTPVDWVLRMWRFPKSAELTEIAAHGAFDADLADRLGREIHAFHARSPVRKVPGARPVADILDELARVFADMAAPLGAERIARFDSMARADLARRAALLDARSAAGHVRRVHGDLHLGNIVVLDGRPVLFDALEFDETLGTCDVLYDLAFLLMDLSHRGLPERACGVQAGYLLAADGAEDAGTAALPLFQAVRAGIRAMTTVQADRAKGVADRGAGRAYLQAALDLLAPPPAVLVAVGGLSGTGKTRLARALAPHLGAAPGAIHLRSDTERKEMARAETGTQLGAAHYTQAARHLVYDRMLARAGVLLAAGRSVIADATFLNGEERRATEATAKAADVAFTGLWLHAPPPTLLARVGARRGDASDADAEVVRRQIATATAPARWLRIDASGPPETTLRRALAALGIPSSDASRSS